MRSRDGHGSAGSPEPNLVKMVVHRGTGGSGVPHLAKVLDGSGGNQYPILGVTAHRDNGGSSCSPSAMLEIEVDNLEHRGNPGPSLTLEGEVTNTWDVG